MNFAFKSIIENNSIRYVISIIDTNTVSKFRFRILNKETANSLLKFIELYEKDKTYDSIDSIAHTKNGLILRQYGPDKSTNVDICIRSDEHIAKFLSKLKEQLLNNMCFYEQFEKNKETPTKVDDPKIIKRSIGVYDFEENNITKEINFKFYDGFCDHLIKSNILDLMMLNINLQYGNMFNLKLSKLESVSDTEHAAQIFEIITAEGYSYQMIRGTPLFETFASGIAKYCGARQQSKYTVIRSLD